MGGFEDDVGEVLVRVSGHVVEGEGHPVVGGEDGWNVED